MKERITISVDRELIAWIDKRISERIFANRSHALEFLVLQTMKMERGKK